MKKYSVSLFTVLTVLLFCLQAAGKDFGELQKHSLLFAERLASGSDSYIQPNVFVISGDGSVCNRYEMPRIEGVEPLMDDEGDGFYYTKLFRPSVSNKSFGKMFNVAYFNGGSDDDENVTPFQVFSYTGEKVNAKTLNERSVNYDSYRILWGSAALTLPSFDKDVFVNLRTPHNIIGSYQSARLDFFALDRNESGDVSMDDSFGSLYTEKIYMSYAGVGMGLDMAAGDFDNDGYKNDIAVCIYEGTSRARVWLFVYTVSYNDGEITANLKHRGSFDFGTGSYGRADNTCLNVLAGDFDGDGYDEVAIVGRSYRGMNEDHGPVFVQICKYSPDNKNWTEAFTEVSYVSDGACRAVKADVDGDGKDEIVLIYNSVFKDDGLVLQRVFCDPGSITPKEDSKVKKDILNDVDFDVSSVGYHRVFNDKITIVAGPLTGKVGKVKLVDDVAVSFVNNSRSVVSIVPVELDGSKNFTGFGNEKRIYDERVSGGNARGSMITNGFALVANLSNSTTATKPRDLRSYMPDSNNQLLAGLKSQVMVPLYNAILGRTSTSGVSAAYDFSDTDGLVNVSLSFSGISNDEEIYTGDNLGPDIEPGGESVGASSSSSGGCDFGFGGLAMLGLVIMLLKRH